MTRTPADTGVNTVEQFRGFTPARRAVEAELDRAGLPLAVPQRTAWQCAFGAHDALLLLARDGSGNPVSAMSASISRVRVLPRHRDYRVDRWGGSSDERADQMLLDAFARVVSADPLGLRGVLQIFSFDESRAQRLARQVASLGFVRAARPRMYEQTLVIDLAGSEEELFARVHATARRHVRAVAKRGLALRPITDPSLTERLASLYEETFRRSGVNAEAMPWRDIVELSATHPSLSRVVGVFDDRQSGAEALVAFAWGTAHDGYVSYDAGASLRRPDLGNTPLSYAPLWDLVLWARALPAVGRFDLGGATDGGTSDPHSGITEFKRYFSNNLVRVGEEWLLEPSPMRAAIARALGGAKGRIMSLAADLRRRAANVLPSDDRVASGRPLASDEAS